VRLPSASLLFDPRCCENLRANSARTFATAASTSANALIPLLRRLLHTMSGTELSHVRTSSLHVGANVPKNPAEAKEPIRIVCDALTMEKARSSVIAGREGPGEGTGNGRFWQKHSIDGSFPGGHAMFVWTMATVVAHENPRWWVRVLLYGAAATVSVTRFTAHDHFASDTFVGTALGYFIGRHIFHAHCNPDFSEACR
jgi:membrane-associated phospholipid phosphatase